MFPHLKVLDEHAIGLGATGRTDITDEKRLAKNFPVLLGEDQEQCFEKAYSYYKISELYVWSDHACTVYGKKVCLRLLERAENGENCLGTVQLLKGMLEATTVLSDVIS